MLIRNARAISRNKKGEAQNRFSSSTQRSPSFFKSDKHACQMSDINTILCLLDLYCKQHKGVKQTTKKCLVDMIGFCLNNPKNQLTIPISNNKRATAMIKIAKWLESLELVDRYVGAPLPRGLGSAPQCIQATYKLSTYYLTLSVDDIY